jgi:hypothetical protein
MEALPTIKASVTADNDAIRLNATATGKPGDVMLPEGWVAES